jgi:hypothetical protein
VVTEVPFEVIEDAPLVHGCAGCPVCVDAAGTAQSSRPTATSNATLSRGFIRSLVELERWLD